VTRALASIVVLAGLAVATPAHAAPRHHGLYLRVGIGPGYARGHLDAPTGGGATHGVAISTQLAIGWTPRPGLVVGVGTFPMVVLAPRYDGVDAGGQHVSATGPFVDYYPDPEGGLHLQAGVLFAAGYLDGGARASHVGVGIGATAGVGYEVHVADRWSLGAIARVTGYRLAHVDDTLSVWSPAALLAVTYH